MSVNTAAVKERFCSTSISSSMQDVEAEQRDVDGVNSNVYNPTVFTQTDEQFIHLSTFTDQQSQQPTQEDETHFQINTEVDRMWFERITENAKSSGVENPRVQSVRYPLEDFLLVYREKHPDKGEQEIKRIENLLEDVLRRAYEDMAPPEISVEEFEMYVSFFAENEVAKLEEQTRLPWMAKEASNYVPRNDAHRYLKFLFKSYWKRKSDERTRVKKREEHLQRDRKETATWLTALSKVHLRVGKNAARDKLAVGARVGLPLVLDMSYEHMMNEHAVKDMARQILVMLSFFSKIPEPFHLYVTNLDERSRVRQFLDKYVHGIEHVSATVTSLNCMEIFPPKQLVYLSPDSPYDLQEYDPEDIFVIGGLVDKVVLKNASFDVARKHRIRTARFPIKLNARIKSQGPLNFIEVVHILNRFTSHGDIHRALLEGVSKRRLLNAAEVETMLNNQLNKASRLVGDPNFVLRAQQQAQKRMEVFNHMQSLNLEHLRQKAFEPHEVASFHE